MEIVEITRGHIVVQAGKKNIKIYGEALLRVHGGADFVVYSSSIERCGSPDECEEVSEEEKLEVLDFLRREFVRRNMNVEID